MSRLLTLAALAAVSAGLVAADQVGAFRPNKEPVSPSGVRASVDIPPDQHMRNTGGMGRRGPGTGAGLCVFTSVEVMDRWQGGGELKGFQAWMKSKPGGGSPPKLAAMIKQFCAEKGLKEPAYVQHTGGDVEFLEFALKTRRMVGVTYAGNDDHYPGPIDHMVDLVHLDATSACIVDNNRPGQFVWMSRAEFLTRWQARGGGWAVVLLNAPPPPVPAAVKPQLLQVPADCPDGKCPLRRPAAPPAPAAAPKVDRSASSVYVERDTGGRSECGTATVVASRGGRSLVMTNAHVVPDGSRPVTVHAGGKKFAARHVASTSVAPGEPDLCALVIDAELPAAAIAATAPPPGTVVFQWGYGGKTPGQAPTLKSGQTVPQGNYVGAKSLRTTVPSQSGDSGSGLFTSAGELVGVCWGRSDAPPRHQYAVTLAAVKEFVQRHAAALPDAVGAEAGGTNYGIDREDLDALTSGGRQRYWVRGRETHGAEALDAVGSGSLVDDSGHYFLSAVGDAATARQLDAALADPRAAKYRDRLLVRVYPRESWVARDRLKAAVTLQEPAPKGGAVVGTLDQVDVELLIALLRAVFEPVPQPMPGPVTPDVTPNQNPPAPTPAAPSNGTPWLLLGAVAAVALLLGRWASANPRS